MTRNVVILGSTGSIGTQALDIVSANPSDFRVIALSAGGSNIELLAQQAVATSAAVVGIAREIAADDFIAAFQRAASAAGVVANGPEVVIGPSASEQIAGLQCDVVLNGITGSVGLLPTMAALRAGTTLALANKESLVVGGAVVTGLARPGQIVPVDSEHSALAQCLRGGTATEVRRLVLTASGGPFRGWSEEKLANVTVADALAHPTWDMGPVVTVNSATMVNKGLEIIEAHLLFDLPYDRIDAVIHPQSMVHSMVEFVDGSTLAQVSPPDMRLPISMGLAWPHRVADAAPNCDWTKASTWEFMPLDTDAFPAVRVAREAGEAGGTAPAVFNAANEAAVGGFLAGDVRFTQILDVVEEVLDFHMSSPLPEDAGHIPDASLTVETVLAAEQWARTKAAEVLGR